MQYLYYFLVFLSTVSVAVSFEVKKIYVIERDFKTGQLRARRQNVPSHTVARIGGQSQDHHQQQNVFNVAVSPPPLQTASAGGGGQQQVDLASTIDLTTDGRATPIDYLTPPPNAEFQYQNFVPSAGIAEPMTAVRAESHQSQQGAPPPFAAPTVHTSPFTPGGGGGFPSGPQAQFSPSSPHAVQASSPSNQVHSLTFANPPVEQFTPFAPTLVQPQQQQQQGGRWDLGFDANDILTPPFASAPEQPGQTFFQQQDFGPEAAGSVRSNKQYLGGGTFFGGNGDTAVAANTKFTPLDAVVRTPPPSNNNVYWGTPKTAQQQPIRPSPSFAEPNAFRFNNNHHHHHNHHHNNNHHHQYVDAFPMPFTGQFDGPLSQGTVADHVVHSSFRVKRQAEHRRPSPQAAKRNDDDDAGDRFGDRKPVYSYVKTDRNGNFKWSVRHGY